MPLHEKPGGHSPTQYETPPASVCAYVTTTATSAERKRMQQQQSDAFAKRVGVHTLLLVGSALPLATARKQMQHATEIAATKPTK